MRILCLDLKAFGPFTDLTLDLSAGSRGGLHVIHGANEAGKSSARRALCDLLYGFEQRTGDAHLHPYDALRIGALIEGEAGTLYVERRKARKGSLRDAAGEVLDDATLERFLGGIDRATFTRAFGLGHEELRAGGEEMIRGESSIGETLFDAGAGGPFVGRLREFLTSEWEKLYRPRGKQQELNLLLERQAEAKRRCQDAVLLPESYREQRDGLEKAELELAALRQRIETLRAEEYRLSGLVGCLPALERRAAVLSELGPLAVVPDVPESARERRESAQAREVEARTRAAKLTDEIARAKKRLSEIAIPEALLSLGETRVSAFADGVGRTRKAREDLPRILNEKRELSAEMTQSLRRLGREPAVGSPGLLRVRPADSARIQKLATLRDKLDERVESARRRIAESERERSETEKRLARLPPKGDAEALARALSLARSVGDVETPLGELARGEAELEREISSGLAGLAPFRGSVETLAGLVAPAPELVERLSAEAAEVHALERSLHDETAAVSRRLAEARTRSATLAAAGDLPAVRDLDRARTERDQSGRRLAERWSSGSAFAPGEWASHDGLVGRADAVSDRLRREADRLAQQAQLEAEASVLAGEMARLGREREALAERRLEHGRSLAAACAGLGLSLESPAELSGFVGRRRDLLVLAERRHELAAQRERLERSRTKLERALGAALGDAEAGDSLAFRVERAATLELGEGKRASEQRELWRLLDGLTTRLEQERSALESATIELSSWHESWAAALGALGAGTPLEPEAALGLLEELAALAQLNERIERLERRVQGIRRDESALAADVREPAAELGITLDPETPDRAAGELVDRFRSAQAALEERERIEAELFERESELADQRETLAAAERELDELCRQAGAREASELGGIERASARARELRHMLEAIESTLVDTSGGRSVAALVAEAMDETAPRLKARLDEIERELGEAEEQRAASMQSIASVQAGLRLHSEASGADAIQEEQALAAEVRDRVERYARLRVAGALLERAVERYRVQNQGPVLKRAAELFSRLTDGAYERLLVGRDEQAIAVVTPDGRELLPDALSDGTRYQLYLALRLASIERRADHAEPTPLVLDDAIIHSDEARTRATFRVLHALSERVQVLVFTHHAYVVALAKEVGAEAVGAASPIGFHELVRAGEGTPPLSATRR